MHIYRSYVYRPTTTDDLQGVTHSETLAKAHAQAKLFHKDDWNCTYIDLLHVPTGKSAMVALLNGIDHKDHKVLRTWELTARGGLQEVKVEPFAPT